MGGVLSLAVVLELAGDAGLYDSPEQLVSWLQPAWRLLPVEDDRLGMSKVGGCPDLGPGESWPVNPRGVPLAFVAQINCGQLPAFDLPWTLPVAWEHRGRLIRVFADLLDNPVTAGPAIALAVDPAGPLRRTAAPAIPDPFPPGGEWDDYEPRDLLYVLPETAVRLHPFLTALEYDAFDPRFVGWDDERIERYESWAADLRVDGATDWPPLPYQVQHLLGAPISIHDHVRHIGPVLHRDDPVSNRLRWVARDETLTGQDAWQILLGLHTDDAFGLQIHDGGALHILVPTADLRTGRLDRLICANDSG